MTDGEQGSRKGNKLEFLRTYVMENSRKKTTIQFTEIAEGMRILGPLGLLYLDQKALSMIGNPKMLKVTIEPA